MAVYNSSEARTRLCELVRAAVRGEEVIIANAGRPLVQLEAVTQAECAEIERQQTTERIWEGLSKQGSIP